MDEFEDEMEDVIEEGYENDEVDENDIDDLIKDEEDIKYKSFKDEYKIDAKTRKRYYPEEIVTPMVIEYQKKLVYNENGEIIDRDKVLENKIMFYIEKVALAIINNYHYWMFEEIDDLMQECLKEAYRNLPKFNPEYIVDEETKKKTTTFNYFSLIFKRHLLNYTLRRKKHRDTADVDIMLDVENRREINYDILFQDIESGLFRVINENFLRDKRKKYINLAAILMDYIVKTKMVINKSDLLAWYRSFGYKSSDWREFIKDLTPYKDVLYQIV